MKRPEAIWLYDSSTGLYTDLTDNVRTNTDFNFIADASDYILIGLSRRTIGLYCDLTTNGSYTGLAYYYLKDRVWKKLSLIDSYAFDSSKYQRWVMPNDWTKDQLDTSFPETATPPDTDERYWIKISVTAVTTTAVIDTLRAIPFVEYATSDDVSDVLQVKTAFNEDTKPTNLVVETMIREAEDRIDYLTQKSFRFNVSIDEIVQYNRYGVFPRHRDIYKLYSVKIWNGNGWDTLTEGRQNDYFLDGDRGMIYITRLFLLPAVYGMAGRYYQFGYGEYAYSCQLNYVWCRDSETHPEFYMAKDLAVKMVAIKLLRHHDYSAYVNSGTDKVPLESKVRLLSEDVDRELDELRGVQIW